MELLKEPTTKPPIIPAITPDNRGAPLARATPRHKGRATKNTTILEGKSFFNLENIMVEILNFKDLDIVK